MNRILTLLLLFISAIANAQSTSYDTTFTGSQGSAWNAMVNLPDDYYTSTERYPIVIYLPGNGETAQDGGVTLMDNYGPHYFLRTQGWNGQITLGNGTWKFIFVSLQLPFDNTNPITGTTNSLLKPKLDAILGRYRVKPGCVIGMGISAGAGTMGRFHTYRPTTTDESYASYFDFIVSVQSRDNTAAEGGGTLTYPSRWGHATVTGGAKYLGFTQHLDGTEYARTIADNIRDSVPNAGTWIRTIYNGGGHTGFNNYFNPSNRNWTSGNNANVVMFEGPSIDGNNVYEWAFRKLDTNRVYDPTGIQANAGADFFKAYNQDNNTPSFTITGSASGGTPTSYAWTQVSGPNTATLTNANAATVTVSAATKGYYVFQLTVSDGSATDADSVSVWIRDYNEAGSWPCRDGGGRSFEIGEQLITGVVTSTYINLPYINRAPYLAFGEELLGGDTIKIHRNPNNSGNWQTIVMGYFGGSEGCPIVVMPFDSSVKYGGTSNQSYFRLASAATGDSNFVNYVKFNGIAHRQGPNRVYGFEYSSSDQTGYALVAHLVKNLEINGFYSNGGMMLIKKDSDSSLAYSIYNNYNPGPYHFNNIHINRSGGEGMYIGTTDIDGGSFDGPTHRGADGSVFDSVIVSNCQWDGVQPSNLGDSLRLSNIVAYNNGLANMSSQQSASFVGGYNTNAVFEKSVLVKSTGGPNFFGADSGYFRQNIVDSMATDPTYSSVYVSMTVASSQPPPIPDSLVMFTQNNIIAHSQLYAINYANSNNRMKDGGAITGNKIVDAAGRGSALINTTNVVVPTSNNTFVTALNIDTTVLAASLPAWSVYKRLRTQPAATAKVSFFDEEAAPSNQSPEANAGADVSITLPVDGTLLEGSGTDADGTITTYAWTKVSGPSTYTIESASTASTVVSGLVAGTYVFRLTVTDDDGATDTDDVTVVVTSTVGNRKQKISLKIVNQ